MRRLLDAPNNPNLLRGAITQEELHGINRFVLKKDTDKTIGASSSPPPLPAKASSVGGGGGGITDSPKTGSLDRRTKQKLTQQSFTKMKNGCLEDSFDESEERFESCIDITQSIIQQKSSPSSDLLQKQVSDPGHSAGKLALDFLSKKSAIRSVDNVCHSSTNNTYPYSIVNSKQSCDKIDQLAFGISSRSVPNSPGAITDPICNSLSKKCHKMQQQQESRNCINGDGRKVLSSCNSCDDSSGSSPPCVSCDSYVSTVAMMTASSGSFTYSPPAVRISKSEDQLQCPDDGEVGSANTDLDDDVTASLNTLLDTRDDDSPLQSPITAAPPDIWLLRGTHPPQPPGSVTTSTSAPVSATSVASTATITTVAVTTPITSIISNSTSMVHQSAQQYGCPSVGLLHSPVESVHSSHDSDSPLLHSPSSPQSPHSPVSPSSSVPYSSSGVYDKIKSSRDINQSGRSGNMCSNSSSLTTSPDTDIPDELEWDETTPSYVPTSLHSSICGHASVVNKPAMVNGHNATSRNPSQSSSCINKPGRHVAIPNNTQPHFNLVNVDTSSSSSSSNVMHERAKRKKDEHRIVIKVAGPDKSSSSSTLDSASRRRDSSSSIDRKNSSNRRLRKTVSGEGSIVSSLGVTSILKTSHDGVLEPSVANVLTSTHSVGVIPGVDPDVTPTNTPHQTPPISPTQALGRKHSSTSSTTNMSSSQLRHQLSTSPTRSSTTSPPPPQVSPQTPGSGTLSPETLAYQQLWESEDELTGSCISEDDASRSVGGTSAGGKSGIGGGHGNMSHHHSSSSNSSSTTTATTTPQGSSLVIGDGGDVAGGGGSGSGGAGVVENSSNNKASSATTTATSPPLSEDESDIESLHSFHYSPKAVDIPSAVRLAKRLYHLDGFKKTDVSRHLSKK